MTDHPMLFSAPMIQALLAGRKTQTRRIINPQPIVQGLTVTSPENFSVHCRTAASLGEQMQALANKRVGDRIWVREAWRCNGWGSDVATVFYRASEGEGYTAMCEQWPVLGRRYLRPDGKWRPSLHMPRWVSRITLTVTDVRVQRLQDISEPDAWAEGCERGEPLDNGLGFFPAEQESADGKCMLGWDCARDWYADLWDTINGSEAWDANPWVVATTFTVQRGNIDAAAPP